jgi:hypothetical protein
MNAPDSVSDLMTHRFSCRTFSAAPIGESARADLAAAAGELHSGPFGSRLRFGLAAATEEDGAALKRLGTYGTIRGAAAFILGAAEPRRMYLEDYGYAMETLILHATRLGLGTCWLGGFFTRGSFSRRFGVGPGERMPAVTAVGRVGDEEAARDGIFRRGAGGSRRKDWGALFFDGSFETPLSREASGAYESPLEMVRWAPSASNRQPWRIVRHGSSWHFFIRRTPGYPPRISRVLMGIEDLQRVDSGIAMCHFELTAREQGLRGRWAVKPPEITLPDTLTEYSATWEE